MTIHRTLLISYLFISLASALLIALMIFSHFRNVLRQEIEYKLESQAVTVMNQIDTTLFERLQNMASWSQLDVMQEIRTRDVDKRLSQFLLELHLEYEGVYQQIFVTNLENQIIAASHSGFIGIPLKTSIPWKNTKLNQHEFEINDLDNLDNLNISIAIVDAFQTGTLGRLTASFNWQEIIKLLNNSLSSQFNEALYYTLLVDEKGRVIANSSNLNNKISQFFVLDESVIQNNNSGALTFYAPFLEKEMLVGYSQSKGQSAFKGLGWQILILQDSNSAFAPILQVWNVMLVFLCLTLFLGSIVSLWMAEKISKPITKLAKSTQNFMLGKPTEFHNIKASTEISELNTQFAEMINSLEKSRLDVARIAKLAVIGEMAASMAHEVRTPLGILRSSAQILQRETQLSDIGLEMTGYILSETKRLNGLVTTMLECARPRPPELILNDVQQIIEHILELLRTKIEEKQVTLQIEYSTAFSVLLCDKDQLIQVFLNLIMNAIQHVSEQGNISITIQENKKYLEIRICDDGTGIAKDKKHTVFDPFYTQRDEGVGLGLTVVQQVVLAHHGRIFITDNLPKGACFHVQLPIEYQN